MAYKRGWSGFKNAPGLVDSADFEYVCPVIGCTAVCSAVVTDWNKVCSLTCGPTGFNVRGKFIESNSFPSLSQACKFSSRFSQNNCLGFSCRPCLRSPFILEVCVFTTVTGCLNMDAVCLIGHTKDESVRIFLQ